MPLILRHTVIFLLLIGVCGLSFVWLDSTDTAMLVLMLFFVGMIWLLHREREHFKMWKQEMGSDLSHQVELGFLREANRRFVPQGFLEILGKKTIRELQLGDQVETKMTILFSDIRAYTSLSETMTPVENFKFINAYLGRLGPIIEQHGGFINQYYGDGLMALFLADHRAAVLAAIDIQRALRKYNEERRQKGRSHIITGVGLNTGHLMLGIIGDENRYDAAVISDAVNTAARMEGLNKIFDASVILSEQTLLELTHPEEFRHRFLGKVKVKGKDQGLKVYEFYDGDPEHVQLKKDRTLGDFERGIYFYFDRQFAKASAEFRIVLHMDPEDKAARYYLDKAENFRLKKTSEKNWGGEEEILVK